MKWIMFTGTWRLTNSQVEEDVRNSVREVISRGDGIVTGGATGVDYFSMDECIKLNALDKLKVIIPAELDFYIKDYSKNWCQEPITKLDIDNLGKVLHTIKENSSSLIEMPHDDGDITQEDYNTKHNEEVKIANEVYAFQVNESTGTQDKIDKSIASGLVISLHKKYTI